MTFSPITIVGHQVGIRKNHIRIRFFIKDKIAMGDSKVKYIPTGNMLSGYFTNPLQGAAIREFRANIQGILEETLDIDLGWDRPKGEFIHTPQECVDNNDGRRTDRKRTGIGRSQETYPVNPVVRMADPISAVVYMVSYSDLVKKKMLSL